MRTTRDAYSLAEALEIWDSPRDKQSKAREGVCCKRSKHGHTVSLICTTRASIIAFYPDEDQP